MGRLAQIPLKLPWSQADMDRVRLSRLVIEGTQNRVALSLHPKLTVVAGVPAPVRVHLVNEILGGFTGTRSGVHLELVNEIGRRITVIRPAKGPHKVAAPDEKLDLTEDFSDDAGRTDVLARYGIDSGSAGRVLHVGPDATRIVTHEDAVIARLSGIDQPTLWSAAARVQVTHAEFESLSQELATSGDVDDEAVAAIEERHQGVEAAVDRQQRIQRHLIRLALFSLVVAVPATLRVPALGSLLICIAAASVATGLVVRSRVEAARRREADAVATAGGSSYLGFMVKQVDGLMQDTDKRRRLTNVAADHRNAAIAWTRLAGDVTVEWTLAHQAEIDATAKFRDRIGALDPSSPSIPALDERTAATARTVLRQMAELRRIGYGAESFPLLLDDPFVELDPPARMALLDLIARSAGSPQVVLLTEQVDIADWARSRSATGDVSLLEALGPSAPTGRSTPSAGSAQAGPPPAPSTTEPPAAATARTADGYRALSEARSLAG